MALKFWFATNCFRCKHNIVKLILATAVSKIQSTYRFYTETTKIDEAILFIIHVLDGLL